MAYYNKFSRGKIEEKEQQKWQIIIKEMMQILKLVIIRKK